jgi:RHS repeat-associated protein
MKNTLSQFKIALALVFLSQFATAQEAENPYAIFGSTQKVLTEPTGVIEEVLHIGSESDEMSYENQMARRDALLKSIRASRVEKYRFGFQGQEYDEETGWVNYKYRMDNPAIGRFFAIDPLAKKYPHNSPYAFSENRVIDGVELEGLEVAHYTFKTVQKSDKAKIVVITQQVIYNTVFEKVFDTHQFWLRKEKENGESDFASGGIVFSSYEELRNTVELIAKDKLDFDELAKMQSKERSETIKLLIAAEFLNAVNNSGNAIVQAKIAQKTLPFKPKPTGEVKEAIDKIAGRYAKDMVIKDGEAYIKISYTAGKNVLTKENFALVENFAKERGATSIRIQTNTVRTTSPSSNINFRALLQKMARNNKSWNGYKVHENVNPTTFTFTKKLK